MGNTLQDQFLKMGLVDKKKANTIKKSHHNQRTGQGAKEETQERSIQVRKAQEKKKERSRLLNQKRNEEIKEQETAARIRQLIDSSRLPMEGGEAPYNFTDTNKIKRLFLTKIMVERLSSGDLAIVRQAGEYQIVPAGVAEKVQKFNKNLVVVFHAPKKNISPGLEDPYAEYQVPDDLMW
jgi:uncharacterized protein